ncbi:MAG: sigma-70 family RNA polymerase sigma factor [Pseudomonadota bacterium]
MMAPVVQQDDLALIGGARDGDDNCFAELVRRYEGTVAATVVSMLGAGDEADEVGQEVMIKFYRSLGRFEGNASVRTYITRIAINSARDALRRRKRNLMRFFAPRDNDSSWEDHVAGNQDQHRDTENRDIIQFALNRLHPDIRAVVVLRLMEGCSTEEAADILEVPSGTILSRLSRGKAQMAQAITGAST